MAEAVNHGAFSRSHEPSEIKARCSRPQMRKQTPKLASDILAVRMHALGQSDIASGNRRPTRDDSGLDGRIRPRRNDRTASAPGHAHVASQPAHRGRPDRPRFRRFQGKSTAGVGIISRTGRHRSRPRPVGNIPPPSNAANPAKRLQPTCRSAAPPPPRTDSMQAGNRPSPSSPALHRLAATAGLLGGKGAPAAFLAPEARVDCRRAPRCSDGAWHPTPGLAERLLPKCRTAIPLSTPAKPTASASRLPTGGTPKAVSRRCTAWRRSDSTPSSTMPPRISGWIGTPPGRSRGYACWTRDAAEA